MGKSEVVPVKINEVEAQVGITKKNIRFYEEQGLLSPRRNSENGYRDYGEEEVKILRQIKLMRKLGVPLDFPVTEVSVNGKTAYSVGDDGLLLVCLSPDIQPGDVEQMAEYAPAKAVISRDSFADDTAMANAWYILRDRGVDLKLV